MGTVALIDILKETVLRTGCLTEVSAVAGSGTLPVEVLAERLMLAVYAYGTNTGIRAVAGGGGHGHSADEIRYVRRRYLHPRYRSGGRDRYRQRHLCRSPAHDLGRRINRGRIGFDALSLL